jgi:hypothetical protein
MFGTGGDVESLTFGVAILLFGARWLCLCKFLPSIISKIAELTYPVRSDARPPIWSAVNPQAVQIDVSRRQFPSKPPPTAQSDVTRVAGHCILAWRPCGPSGGRFWQLW